MFNCFASPWTITKTFPLKGKVSMLLFIGQRANLQPVKKVTYTFDPMTENHASLRHFMFFWNTKKVRATNLKLLVKTEIVDDRRDPAVVLELNNGRTLEVRTGNLTELEIASVVNSHLLPLVKEEEEEAVSKGAKAGGAGGPAKGGKKGRK